MKAMTQETKDKLSVVHKKLAQDPARLARLRLIATDPGMKAKRAAAMKKKWEDPVWRAAALAKMKASREAKAAEEAQAEADRTTPAEKAKAEALVAVAPGDNPNIPTEADLTGVPAEVPVEEATTQELVETPAETPAPVEAPVKKKRVVTDEQKAKYAANRKAKRAAAKS